MFHDLFPIFLLSLACTITGSAWIDQLYPKAELRGSLSFPEEIPERSKFRRSILFFSLLLCLYRSWTLFVFPRLGYTLLAIIFLLLVTTTDFEQHVILNEMLLFFALAGICYTLHMDLPIANHLLASIGGGVLFLILAMLSNGAIGGGDIKLIATMGLWFGTRPLLSIILYGAMAGGIGALFLLITQKINRKQYLAYGPYFALSGIGIMLSWLRVLF